MKFSIKNIENFNGILSIVSLNKTITTENDHPTTDV